MLSNVVLARTLYISPSGSSSNSGASSDLALDYATAFSEAEAGDTLELAAGTYTVPFTDSSAKNTITFSVMANAANPIIVRSPGFAQAIFDFGFPDLEWKQNSFGFYVTGSYWTFEGIAITRAGYQGAYITGAHNTFRNCAFHDNRNTGLEINKGGSYTTIIQCDSYRNYDIKKSGTMADGFGPKQTQGAGNKFIGCRAWENSDDGFDAYESPESVEIEDSWAFRNGIDVWGYGAVGNGNGFKMGGNDSLANHKLIRCVAFGNPSKGFDQNNNTGGITILNSIAYGNGINFGMAGDQATGEQHTLINNISLDADVDLANDSEQTNSWNLSATVSNDDFVSLDTSLAKSERDADGNIQNRTLFRLVKGSDLIDVGTNIGEAYVGAAPDLGPFECDASSSSSGTSSNAKSSNSSGLSSSSSISSSASSSSETQSSSSETSASSSEGPSLLKNQQPQNQNVSRTEVFDLQGHRLDVFRGLRQDYIPSHGAKIILFRYTYDNGSQFIWSEGTRQPGK